MNKLLDYTYSTFENVKIALKWSTYGNIYDNVNVKVM